jgi:hypothetical protein
MATGQVLLNIMELLDAELQCQAGEEDVTRGLLALNVAQDHFESLASQRGRVLGSSKGTVVTANNTETTTFPAGVLRIDKLQLLDSNSRPKWTLGLIKGVGNHYGSQNWPLNLFLTSSTGEPTRYWTDGGEIYWNPLPSGVHTVRYYGFAVKTDLTAGGTFLYPDIVMLPLASFAVKVLKSGLDDSVQQLDSIAQQVFDPVLSSLEMFNRDGARGLDYKESHNA